MRSDRPDFSGDTVKQHDQFRWFGVLTFNKDLRRRANCPREMEGQEARGTRSADNEVVSIGFLSLTVVKYNSEGLQEKTL